MFFLLLYLQHGITNYNYICPILKHHFQKLIQKHICTVRNVVIHDLYSLPVTYQGSIGLIEVTAFITVVTVYRFKYIG